MLTYTSSRTLFGKLTHDSSTENLSNFDTLQNEIIRKIASTGDYPWKEKSADIATVEDQQGYELPNDLQKLMGVYHTIDSQNYIPLGEITSRAQWDALNTHSATGDTPEWYYIFGGKLECYPIPVTDDNTITVPYYKKHIDLGTADYTTGTITSIANGATTVTGDSTVWTAAMAGRYIQLPDSQWYEIASRTSGTVLEITKSYMGITVAADTATYTIGEISMIPEESQSLPVFEVAEIYFTSIRPDATKAKLYKALKAEGYATLNKEKSASVKITKGSLPITNPQKYYSV